MRVSDAQVAAIISLHTPTNSRSLATWLTSIRATTDEDQPDGMLAWVTRPKPAFPLPDPAQQGGNGITATAASVT